MFILRLLIETKVKLHTETKIKRGGETIYREESVCPFGLGL